MSRKIKADASEKTSAVHRAPETSARVAREPVRQATPAPDSTKALSATPQSLAPADILALQRAAGNEVVQRVLGSALDESEREANRTGMPDHLKAGIESLSGMSMDGVRVHYNSEKPAQVGALAYTQGTDIYLAPGEERHLPHEAWHVVQQRQGRVKPTLQAKGVAINDEQPLEREASAMGSKAQRVAPSGGPTKSDGAGASSKTGSTVTHSPAIQLTVDTAAAELKDQA